MKTIFLILSIIGFSTFLSQGQDRVIYGVVNTLDSIPLIGVEIKIKSTNQRVLTDSLGNFTAACNKEDKLKFVAKGFYTENVKISENTKIIAVNMKLKPGEKQQNYAIGYGYVTDQDKTVPVSNMDIKKSDYSRYNNVYEILQVMGAQVQNGEIILRGSKSFTASNSALIVIDGVISDYSDLNTLPPTDIERIDLLKDPASSVYGSRGANGVVLIETNKGK